MRLARFAEFRVVDMKMPKVPLSFHAHMATPSVVPAVCPVQAAAPPIGPAGTVCAPGLIWARKAVGEADDEASR